MTADEIRRLETPNSMHDAFWLREIAAQLAELNARLRSITSDKSLRTTVGGQ